MGGTQDNGTWSNNHGCDRNTFTQIIYGDGGNAGYDGTNPTGARTSSPADSATRTSATAIPRSGSSAPHRSSRSGEGRRSTGRRSVTRTRPRHAPDLLGRAPRLADARLRRRHGHAGRPAAHDPDIAFMEANCPEFVTPANLLGCGDYRPMGGPYCDGLTSTTTIPTCIDQPGDLAGTFYGADRQGLVVSWVARDSADHGTVWAVTCRSRLRDAQWRRERSVRRHLARIDNPTSPTRYPSGIYVDPANSSHAWITYSGFNASTPTTPGHVFEVTEGNPAVSGSGTFTNLNVESGTSAFPTPTATATCRCRTSSATTPPTRCTWARTSASSPGTNDGGELAHDEGHASLRGHAPRDPAVQPRPDLHGAAASASACCTQRRTRRASGASTSVRRTDTTSRQDQ